MLIGWARRRIAIVCAVVLSLTLAAGGTNADALSVYLQGSPISGGAPASVALVLSKLFERPLVYEGITLVINKQNTWAMQMTVDEMKMIWDKDSKAKKWNDIRPEWPAENITLYGPGQGAVMFEYFTEAVHGADHATLRDYNAAQDDQALVRGVAGDKYALGCFTYTSFKQNDSMLNAVSIKQDATAPAILPTSESLKNGTYTLRYPLNSRTSK